MEKVMQIADAAFAYARQLVWQGICLDVFKGELLCILGPNGCGKTTLLSCMHGARSLKKGTIALNRQPLENMGTSEIARKIGVVFQEHTTPFPYAVLDVVLMGRGPHLGLFQSPSAKDRQIALQNLDHMGVADLKDKRYTDISGGERQLVLIARTLTQEPEVILLDEPTSHLDFKNQALVLGMIKRLTVQGLTVVMTSHFPNHALICADRVAMMNNKGVVAVGETQKMMTETNLEKTYDIGVKIITVQDQKRDEALRFCMPCMEDLAQ
jgi:iron complex transport system ATP-binding protein